MIVSAQMLRTAERLARAAYTGSGSPAPCDLRRSTSTAYYALFHQLTWHGVHASVAAADEDDVALVARWFSHQDAAEPGGRAAHDVYRRFLLLALLSSGGPKSRR